MLTGATLRQIEMPAITATPPALNHGTTAPADIGRNDKKTINNDFENYLKGKSPKEEKKSIIKTNSTIVSNGALKAYEILIRYMMFSRNDQIRIASELDQIASLQSKYIPNSNPTQIITLIYKYYNLNPNDKYFDLYLEFISKIQVYFKSNEIMIIEKFLDPLAANLKDFYNDRIKNTIVTDEKKKQKEINDCYKKLVSLIINSAIKEYKDLIKNNPNDQTQYSQEIIKLKLELTAVSKG